jgi:hypothetical protein
MTVASVHPRRALRHGHDFRRLRLAIFPRRAIGPETIVAISSRRAFNSGQAFDVECRFQHLRMGSLDPRAKRPIDAAFGAIYTSGP